MVNIPVRWAARLARPKRLPRPQLGTGYYPQQPSCQIPNLFVLLERFLGVREHGWFVEVGAYDGIFVSNTWGLAARGWTGLMVEPVPAFADRCRRNHEGHRGVTVVETAVGAEDGVEVELALAGTLTTANKGVHAEYRDVEWARSVVTEQVITTSMVRLDSLLEDHMVPPHFDLLVVDVEGYESQVFAGFDLTRWSPGMLIVELLDTHPHLTQTAKADATLELFLVDSGYVVAFKDHINTVFVRRDLYDPIVPPRAGR